MSFYTAFLFLNIEGQVTFAPLCIMYCPANGQTPFDGPIPQTEELQERYKIFINSTEFFLRN